MDYDLIIEEIKNTTEKFKQEMTDSLVNESGLPPTHQTIVGYSNAYSKMFFNYAAILLHDKMEDERINEPTFDEEVDQVLEKMSKIRPVPKDVLENYIAKKDELRSDMESVFNSSGTPSFMTDAVEHIKSFLDNN